MSGASADGLAVTPWAERSRSEAVFSNAVNNLLFATNYFTIRVNIPKLNTSPKRPPFEQLVKKISNTYIIFCGLSRIGFVDCLSGQLVVDFTSYDRGAI